MLILFIVQVIRPNRFGLVFGAIGTFCFIMAELEYNKLQKLKEEH